MLTVTEIDIEVENIQTILSIREFKESEDKMNELKENIQYDLDIHILLQKFYAKQGHEKNSLTRNIHNDVC